MNSNPPATSTELGGDSAKLPTTRQALGNTQMTPLVETVGADADAIVHTVHHETTQNEPIVVAIALLQRVAMEHAGTGSRVGKDVKQPVDQAGLLDRVLARFKLHHTDHRETKGMG